MVVYDAMGTGHSNTVIEERPGALDIVFCCESEADTFILAEVRRQLVAGTHTVLVATSDLEMAQSVSLGRSQPQEQLSRAHGAFTCWAGSPELVMFHMTRVRARCQVSTLAMGQSTLSWGFCCGVTAVAVLLSLLEWRQKYLVTTCLVSPWAPKHHKIQCLTGGV